MKIKILALLFVLALFAVACSLKAQSIAATPAKANCTVDQNGNYKALPRVQAQPTPTGKTFTDSKGAVHKVWVSPAGKEFYTRVSAKGNEYKVYITVQ